MPVNLNRGVYEFKLREHIKSSAPHKYLCAGEHIPIAPASSDPHDDVRKVDEQGVDEGLTEEIEAPRKLHQLKLQTTH